MDDGWFLSDLVPPLITCLPAGALTLLFPQRENDRFVLDAFPPVVPDPLAPISAFEPVTLALLLPIAAASMLLDMLTSFSFLAANRSRISLSIVIFSSNIS